jgi:glycerol-3-phosphate acyltransferase PlsY
MELVEYFIFFGACLLSYLLGNLSIARLITKKESNGGIKTQGSGNPGTMNMLRTHGVGMGVFTLICDALKGVIPSLFGLLYF